MSFSNIGNLLSSVGALGNLTKVATYGDEIAEFAVILDSLTDFKDAQRLINIAGLSDEAAQAALSITHFSDGLGTASTSIKKATPLTNKLGNAFSGLLGVIKAHPYVAVGTAVVAATAIGIKAYQEYKENLVETATEATSAWESTKTSLQDYTSQYEELKNQLESGNLSEAETISVKQQILDIQSQITSQYGDQASGIDLVNGKLETQLGIIQNISQEEAQRNLNENQKSYDDAEKEMLASRSYQIGALAPLNESATDQYNLANEKIREIAKEFEDLGIELRDNGYETTIYFKGDATKADEVINQFETRVRNMDTSIYGKENDAINSIIKWSSEALTRNQEILDTYQNNYKSYLEQSLYAQGDGGELSKYSQAIEEYNTALLSGDTKEIDRAKLALNEATEAKEEFLSASGNAQYTEMFDELGAQIDIATEKYLNFTDALSGEQRTGNIFEEQADKIKFYADAIQSLGLDSTDIFGALTTDGFQNGERFIEGLAEIYGVDLSDSSSITSFVDVLEKAGIVAEATADSVEEVATGISLLTEETQNAISQINAVTDALSSQANGKSISLDTFNSEELADYRSALEYVNGTMQLNEEKVDAITKAKAEEAIATNDANKALKQSEYLKNAARIEELRKELNGLTEGQAKYNDVKSEMDSLLADNSAIASECQQYDLLSASIREAIGEYQKWLTVNAGSDYGDMFNGTMEAYQRIMDTYDSDSDIYNNFGSKKFDAAVDLIVPDTVDAEDTEAIAKYMANFKQYLKFDDDGNVDGMNIGQFCKKAAEAGLMALDEAGENYVLAGQVTMEDFAEGLELSMPMVQAFFDQMQLKGATFDWADEAVKTVGDLGVKAYESAEAIRALEGHENFEVKMDVSGIENVDAKIATLDETIAQMERFKVGADTTEIEYANDIIQYCVAQKQSLSEPVIMSVDISQLDGEIADVVTKLQELQELQNQYEILASINADTSAVEAEMATVAEELKTIAPDITAKLNIDTTDKESIVASIAAITPEMLVKAGVDETAIVGYTPENKTATVTYQLDSTRVDAYNPKNLTRYVTYKVVTSGEVELNGTAHAKGTAYAGGTLGDTSWIKPSWRTKDSEIALTGEVKPEMVVDPKTNTWWTVGDNGAEFAHIPQGAIVFNGEQTEQLLSKGHINSRGKARAHGTAYVTGVVPVSTFTGYNGYNPNGSSGKSGNNGGNNGNNKGSDEFKEDLNWIEIAISRVQRLITNFGKTVSATYKAWSTRNKAITDEVSKINEEISLQQQAYNKYMQLANGVGLSDYYKKLVQNGAIAYETITDEALNEKIQKYQDFYEKALECSDAVIDLKDNVADLAQEKFDNVVSEYDDQLSVIEHRLDMIDGTIEKVEEQGYLVSKSYYEELIKQEQQNISVLENEYASLTTARDEAMKVGSIEKYSEAWYEMEANIMDVEEAILDANTALIEYNNSLRELEWDVFDKMQEMLSEIQEESDFLIELMSDVGLFNDNGTATAQGQATLGLHAVNYNAYLAQADEYAKELLDINKDIANDPNNQNLLERRKELLEAQRDMISSAEDEKQAIKDLMSDGYDALLKNQFALSLSSIYSKDDIEVILRKLDTVSNNYEISKRATSIVVYNSEMPEMVKIYLVCKKVEGMSDQTLYNYGRALQKFFFQLQKAPENITPNDIRVYLYRYQETNKISNRSLDKIRQTICCFFTWANSEGYLSRNPAITIKPIKFEKKERKPLTQRVWNDKTGWH